MGCSCSDHDHDHEHGQRVRELLGSVGLSEVFDQGRSAIAEAGTALDQLNRFERAIALGFETQVADVYRQAAERSNQRAQEQVQAVLARLNHRTKEKDWKGHVNRVRTAFKERGGATKLTDLREEIRVRLLHDDSGLSASVAELSLTALDAATKAASRGDLNEVAAHMRGIMESALQGFASPEMGRQPIGIGLHEGSHGKAKRRPIGGGQDVKGWCVALGVCLAWAYSSLIASLIICFAVPFCWCCFHLAVLGAFMVHHLACFAAFYGPCRAQGG